MRLTNLFKYWTRLLLTPDRLLKDRYESFKSLLAHDKRAHELLAELEEVYYGQVPVDLKWVEKTYSELADSVARVIEALHGVCPARYRDLEDYFRRIDGYARYFFRPPAKTGSQPWVLPLEQAHPKTDLAGGKAANLSAAAERLGLPVPRGFVITTAALDEVVRHNELQPVIDECLTGLDLRSPELLNELSGRLTRRFVEAEIPPAMSEAILSAARSLDTRSRLAVRSSAVSEDSEYSFAGQYQTVLNVEPRDLIDAYKQVLAGKYTTSALYYRVRCGLSDAETPMAVLVLPMIDAEASGVMYTHDFRSGDSENIVIHAIEGQGRPLVDGTVRPHIYTLAPVPGESSVEVGISRTAEDRGPLEEPALAVLAHWGRKLESFFGSAQDVEWCRDRSGSLFLLQSRPLRTSVTEQVARLECSFEEVDNPVLLEGGEAASSGIAAGPVSRKKRSGAPDALPRGAVLVVRHALPSYVQVLDRLSALVAETGSTAGHLASVAREFEVPMIVNAAGALEALEEGLEVTVHADAGRIYDGRVSSMLESPCARRNVTEDSPYMQRLGYVIRFVSPLELTDPQAENFKPSGCRSIHDIIRFAHEKAVQEMFHLNENRIRKLGGARKLEAGVPMVFYVLDVGGGFVEDLEDEDRVRFEEIRSRPLRAVLKGLRHPDIRWGEFTHFDWASYDKAVMAGGIVKPESAMFASHAVVSNEYANLNLKFGYHFVIIDSVCDRTVEDNYVMFRFSGGGADISKRKLRADFLCEVLRRLHFEVERKSDLVDARLQEIAMEDCRRALDMLGRLLGATRLLDMYLKDESMVAGFVEDFMNGRYHFASVEDSSIHAGVDRGQ